MDSRAWIAAHLERSRDYALAHIEDMAPHALLAVAPGGPHTLWTLGHMAYIEALVRDRFLFGRENPLAEWEPVFDGDAISPDAGDYPPFTEVLATCRAQRAQSLADLDVLTEADLDAPAAQCPPGWEATFGTVRLCLTNPGDHWLMHRGQLAVARRLAGVDRMWV